MKNLKKKEGMDAFPDDFNIDLFDHDRSYTIYLSNHESLKMHRQNVYDTLKSIRDADYKYIVIKIPMELEIENARQLLREICKAFPNRVSYLGYARGDPFATRQYRLIEDPLNPPDCDVCRLCLK
jgi:hypothetical protein